MPIATELERHRPLLATVGAASGTYAAVVALSAGAGLDLASVGSALWFLVGAAYTHGVEYVYHRLAMHGSGDRFRTIRRRHREHHARFHGARFQTRDAEALEHVAGEWFLFPAAFALHAVLGSWLLAPARLVALLGGIWLHYALFETTHWLTHLADNAVDRVLLSIPLLGAIRRLQIEHHRIHHERPDVDFNFNPPFAGDLLAGSFDLDADADSDGVGLVGARPPRATG